MKKELLLIDFVVLTRSSSENKCKHDTGVRGVNQQFACELFDPAATITALRDSLECAGKLHHRQTRGKSKLYH